MSSANGFLQARGAGAEADAMPLRVDGVRAASEAGLRYVREGEPGYRRERRGRGFSYRNAQGARIMNTRELRRIRALAIPPAWSEVWICGDARGHIQATGRDARGRKQYRYHADWRALRDQSKYDQMIAFGEVLPELRRCVSADLARRGLPREKVLAVAIELLDLTRIRVGNPEYARDNDSFGLTTLREEHVELDGPRIRFRFRGKSGVQHEVALSDRRLARILQRMVDLPGEELFQYEDDEGLNHPVSSADVNEYLRAIAGPQFSAKDFRTWGGTVLAVRHLLQEPPQSAVAEARRLLLRAIDDVARALGNTRALCRKCYVHPAVMEAYLEGALHETVSRMTRPVEGLSEQEAMTLGFLRARSAA